MSGYAGYTIKVKLRLAGELSVFAGERDLTVADIDAELVDAFIAQRPRTPESSRRQVPTAKSLTFVVDALVALCPAFGRSCASCFSTA